MPSPIRGSPAALPPRSPAAPLPEPVRAPAAGRLLQWITSPGPSASAAQVLSRPDGNRAAPALRPVDANRCNLRKAIEDSLPLRVQERIERNHEVSGSLRAAINLSCDHADGWMRRKLADAYLQRPLTPAEVDEGVRCAQAYAERLLNEADDQGLRRMIFEEERQTDGNEISSSLG